MCVWRDAKSMAVGWTRAAAWRQQARQQAAPWCSRPQRPPCLGPTAQGKSQTAPPPFVTQHSPSEAPRSPASAPGAADQTPSPPLDAYCVDKAALSMKTRWRTPEEGVGYLGLCREPVEDVALFPRDDAKGPPAAVDPAVPPPGATPRYDPLSDHVMAAGAAGAGAAAGALTATPCAIHSATTRR